MYNEIGWHVKRRFFSEEKRLYVPIAYEAGENGTA